MSKYRLEPVDVLQIISLVLCKKNDIILLAEGSKVLQERIFVDRETKRGLRRSYTDAVLLR